MSTMQGGSATKQNPNPGKGSETGAGKEKSTASKSPLNTSSGMPGGKDGLRQEMKALAQGLKEKMSGMKASTGGKG